MSNKSDPNAIWKLSENDVKGEPLQVGTAKPRLNEMKSAGRVGRPSNHSLQFQPKLIAQSLGNRVIKAERFGNVVFDRRMIFDSQCFRAASTRRRNSASLIA